MPGETALRIAWCCKWLPPQGEDDAAAEALNMRSTTATALGKLPPAAAVARLLGLVRANVAALQGQIAYAAARPPVERALRIGSNLLPLYTHPVARPLYREAALREAIEPGLDAAGRMAIRAGVRLSMHPGQFTVLATESPSALRNALEEVEYHADVMRWLGHAGGWHPHGAHVNVHGGARAPGIAAFRGSLALVSEDARGLLTVENDETAYGLDDLLPLADALPIVLDIHHHWIHSAGEHIAATDPRIATIRESWRGVRPVAHVSAPKPELMPGWPDGELPDFARLVAAGVPVRELRGHSDRLWGGALVAWAASHLDWADLEIEAKDKNLATAEFAAALAEPAPA
jgi:UV DNA damage repair endonuclease